MNNTLPLAFALVSVVVGATLCAMALARMFAITPAVF